MISIVGAWAGQAQLPPQALRFPGQKRAPGDGGGCNPVSVSWSADSGFCWHKEAIKYDAHVYRPLRNDGKNEERPLMTLLFYPSLAGRIGTSMICCQTMTT